MDLNWRIIDIFFNTTSIVLYIRKKIKQTQVNLTVFLCTMYIKSMIKFSTDKVFEPN